MSVNPASKNTVRIDCGCSNKSCLISYIRRRQRQALLLHEVESQGLVIRAQVPKAQYRHSCGTNYNPSDRCGANCLSVDQSPLRSQCYTPQEAFGGQPA